MIPACVRTTQASVSLPVVTGRQFPVAAAGLLVVVSRGSVLGGPYVMGLCILLSLGGQDAVLGNATQMTAVVLAKLPLSQNYLIWDKLNPVVTSSGVSTLALSLCKVRLALALYRVAQEGDRGRLPLRCVLGVWSGSVDCLPFKFK